LKKAQYGLKQAPRAWYEKMDEFMMRVVGGALKEVVHTYVLFILNVEVSSAGNPQKSRSYGFSGNPRRVVQFLLKRER